MSVTSALIIGNGSVPSSRVLRSLARDADFVICADGGASWAHRLKIRPDIIIGDLDSLPAQTRTYFRGVRVIRIREQRSTDLEKALRYCVRRRISVVDITGATGERIDHTTGSLGCLRKFKSKLEMTIIDPLGDIRLVHKRLILSTRKGQKISLIPLNRCTGVTTRHLKYALRNGTLELGVREGISNLATGPRISVSVRRGNLAVFRYSPGVFLT